MTRRIRIALMKRKARKLMLPWVDWRNDVSYRMGENLAQSIRPDLWADYQKGSDIASMAMKLENQRI